MKFIELFAGIGGFRYGLEACNIESTHIGKKSEQEECPQRGEWAADERRVQLCSGDKPALCCDDSQASGLEAEWGASERVLRCGSEASEPPRGYRTFTCVYANEWDKYAASIYRRHYGSIDTRDITTVDVSDIPTHDLLTGGFPCQDYSIAGKGAGLDGSRGTLFFEIARILKHHQPRHFLLENVKGLLSNQDRRTFPYIISVLSDLGYRVESMVLNSKHFGVPQNRERVFIVGHLRGECSGEVFPIRQAGEVADVGDARVAATLQSPGHASGNYRGMNMIEITSNQNQGQRIYDSNGLAKTLAGEAGGQGAKTGLYAMRGRNPDNPSDRTTGSPTEQRLELNTEGTTNTLTSVAKDNLWIEGTRIRRLTPVECERLQAFPDGWTDGISDTQRYKCLGNAVTTSVITAIGEGLLEHINTD